MSNDNKPGNGAGEPAAAIPELEHARNQLRPFLDAHPYSTVDEIGSEEGKQLGIKKPWGDDALVIFLPNDLDAIADALNNLYLPERFTAIWHRDTKELEVIWQAFPLPPAFEKVKNRRFQFNLGSVEYDCQFDRSSDRLLLIAEYAMPVAMSATSHRNLSSYHTYVSRQQSGNDSGSPAPLSGEPLSFWVRTLEWDEDRVLSLVRHLNFYMTFYDNRAPRILIHAFNEEAARPRTRYIIGEFPQRIDAREIEDDLLVLWDASREGDAARSFIYLYRIIEYTSHAHVDRAARTEVQKLLSAPHALSDISRLADEVIAATLTSKFEDPQRLSMFLNDVVNPDLVWREIDQNRPAFSEDLSFDGGFLLKRLISEDATESTFRPNGLDTFATRARSIRNHLSHGRDKTTQTSIMPTVANFRRLEPWVSVLSVVAGEVINFKHIS